MAPSYEHWVFKPDHDLIGARQTLIQRDGAASNEAEWHYVQPEYWRVLKACPEAVRAVSHPLGDLWDTLKSELPDDMKKADRDVHVNRWEQADDMYDDICSLVKILNRRFEGFMNANSTRYPGWIDRYEPLDPYNAGGACLPLTKIRVIQYWVTAIEQRVRPLDRLRFPAKTNAIAKGVQTEVRRKLNEVIGPLDYFVKHPEPKSKYSALNMQALGQYHGFTYEVDDS